MSLHLHKYHEPDFSSSLFTDAPDVKTAAVEQDGIAPEYFHSTSMFPEYFKVNGKWILAEESRMDSSVVIREDGTLSVIENRNLKKGDTVLVKASHGMEFPEIVDKLKEYSLQ